MNSNESEPRVAIFTRDMDGGGAQRVAVTLANTFVQFGIAVDLVLQYARGPYLSELDDGVSTVELNRRVRFGLPRLVTYLRRRRPIAMLSLLTEPNVLAIAAWRLAGCTGCLAVSERTSLVRAHPSRRLAIRMLYRFADQVVPVSRALGRELEDLGVSQELWTFIPNPVPDGALDLGKELSDESRQPPLIVGAGRLTAQKDFQTLIRSFALVRAKRAAKLCILGEGPDRQDLENLVAELGLRGEVDLPGFIAPPWDIMQRASIFVLSSRWEGWPNVLVEALALGVPAVATDCPTGPSEILGGGQFGTLVPMATPDAMAEAIEKTLLDPPDPGILWARANKWNRQEVARQYLRVLRLNCED